MYYLDLLGKPFKWGGRGPEYDCYGLCCELYRRRGLKLPSFESSDNFELINNSIIIGIENYFEKLEKPEDYCFVTFKIRPPFVSHIGLVLPKCATFIHIMQKSSVSVERLDSLLWESKISGFYRFKRLPNFVSERVF